jgi:uncharacterized DUF497 family protein
MQLDKLQKLYNEHKIKWSTHCLARMQERDISIEDVDNCINSGEIIEDYPNDFPHPSCLVFGYTRNNQVIYVVAGTDNNYVYIITAYYPNTDKFEDDLKTRKEK